MKVLTKAQVSELSLKAITENYNDLAIKMDRNTVKRFPTKPKAVERYVQLSDEYNTLHAKKPSKPKKATKSKPQSSKSAPRASIDEKVYVITELSPKSPESAMGVLIDIVASYAEFGEPVSSATLCEEFVKKYKKVYKGDKDVNRAFARGYVAGAVRKGFLEESSWEAHTHA